MKKYIFLLVIVGLISLIAVADMGLAQVSSGGRVINLQSIRDSISSFIGLSDTPGSYSGSGGLCLVVNPGETGMSFGNCSNASGSGSGDITAVLTSGSYLTGGASTGSVSLLLNETFLNITIDARATGGGGFTTDQNDELNTTGSPTFVNITVTGSANISSYITPQSGLKFNIYDDGSDIFLNHTGENFEIEGESTKGVWYNLPSLSNDFKVFEIFSKEASDVTEFVVTKSGDSRASWRPRGAWRGRC